MAPLQLQSQQRTPPAPTALPTLPGPPVRRIESAQSVSTEPLGAISGVRQLSDGRILVNDGTRRRLLLMDSTLQTVGLVLDSLTEVENAYGTRAGALIPYLGDSTLFVDPATLAMLVIDPAGRIARVRSVPRAQDITWLSNTNGSYGWPGIDFQGRLVYRIPAQAARPPALRNSNMPYFPQQPDSAFVVGMHLDTRKIDTIGAVRIPRNILSVRQSSNGGYSVNTINNPLPLLDDWAIMPDGVIAFVRGRDYRVEFLDRTGSLVSSPKLPFPWVRLTDEDKTRFVDSMKTVLTQRAQNNLTQEMIVWSNLLNKPYPATFAPAPGYVFQPGLPRDWILPKGMSFPSGYMFACAAGVTPISPVGTGSQPAVPAAPQAAAAAPPGAATNGGAATPGAPPCVPNQYLDYYGGGYTPPAPSYRAPIVVPAHELPDYKPPFGNSATRADADGNLWIRTIQMKPVQGGLIYDIINRAGQLTDRLQLPSGYSLAGFGSGKVVYLSMRDAKGLHLARVRLK